MTGRVNLEYQVRELFRLKMEELAHWAAENWTVTEAQVIKDNVFDAKPPGYREGYNAAIEGISGAIDCFLEDSP